MRPESRVKSTLRNRVIETIRRHKMIAAGDRIGVAVSAGADSVALWRLLEDFRGDLGASLCVLHLNHGLRGEASDADESFVADLARDTGVEFISRREDVAALAQRSHWNLEDAGRRIRYEFFANVVAQQKCAKVAVAHTADDQAETLLGRLLRGAGPRGLVGIYPVRGSVIRPLLEIRRAELREYLRTKGQSWREDATNADTTRLRARLRHQLLPLLERDFNPAIVDRLRNLSDIFREEEAFWNTIVDERLRASAREIRNGISLPIEDLFALPPFSQETSAAPPTSAAARALSKRMIFALLRQVSDSATDFESDHVAQVLHLASESQSGRHIELPHGIIVARVFDRLEFLRPAASKPAESLGTQASGTRPFEYAVPLSAEGVAAVDVPELGLRFCLKAIDWSLAERDTRYEIGALDADCLRPPLVLRNWRPGDAVRLPGTHQVQKLKQLFVQERISLRERKSWPVLTSAGRIAWTRGWPPAADFSAGKGTRRGVVVLEEKL